MLKLFVSFLLFVLANCLNAGLSYSQITYSGVIQDEQTKEPLPFTNIRIVNKASGTVSNIEGYFVLNLQATAFHDTIEFSYLGYKNVKLIASKLESLPVIYMSPAPVFLGEVLVGSKDLSTEEILKLVRKNFLVNYSSTPQKQRIFYHRFEKVPFKKENRFILKKSDVPGINKKTIENLLRKIPADFIGIQDAVVDLYNVKEHYKLVPIKGISLEETSQQDLLNEIENKLGGLIEDIERSNSDPFIYYKFRTGILSHKLENDSEKESPWKSFKQDSLNYTVQTDLVKGEILYLLNEYANIESKNWEFINQENKYTYVKEDVQYLNDELIYKIAFKPKKNGLFEGFMYVSTSTYAVLQLDFAYAIDKQTERFELFGIGHSMNLKQGRVIFEKGSSGYYAKYIYAKQNESISVDRNFSIIKKQKRFLFDKELNEMKFETQISLELENIWEILVLNQENINSDQYNKTFQPPNIKFKKELAYSTEVWENNTVLAPVTELKRYKRK
ncbi:MAG: carboxypeptidase-like regulatory domain-containing protein [Opitutaceae bacterium]|nr:carboxypeptidase-like regulatory domain-containing protein [Cytophagales bacterium]